MGQEPAEIRRQIEETREHMDETVDALGYKAAVPARTKNAVSDSGKAGSESCSRKGIDFRPAEPVDRRTTLVGQVTVPPVYSYSSGAAESGESTSGCSLR